MARTGRKVAWGSLWAGLCFLVVVGAHATPGRVGNDSQQTKEANAQGRGEVRKLMEVKEYKNIGLLTRKWRFELSPSVQKEILKLLLSNLLSEKKLEPMEGNDPEVVVWGVNEPKEGSKDRIYLLQNVFLEGGRSAFAIELLLPAVHSRFPKFGLPRTSEEEKRESQQSAYGAVILSMEMPVDPDVSRMSAEERLQLANSEKAPTHVLEELAADAEPEVRAAARGRLESRKDKKPLPSGEAHRDIFREGDRAAWAIEQLVHCGLRLSQAKTQEEKNEHLRRVSETIIDAMNMPFDPDPSKLSVEERLRLARGDKTPQHVLRELSKNASAEVRLAVAQNQHAARSILNSMMTDADSKVSSTSAERLLSAPDQTATIRELFARVRQEIQAFTDTRDRKEMAAIIRKWRFETPPDVQKGILAFLISATQSERELKKPNNIPLYEWRPDNKIWNVLVEASPAADKQEPARYRFSFSDAPPVKDNAIEYWRLVVSPADEMPGDANRHIAVWVDKDQGWPRKALALPAKLKSDITVEEVGGAFIIVGAPEDAPVDVLPFIPTSEFRSGAAIVKFTQTRLESETLLELSYALNGKEKLRVRQRWRDGDPWWRYYEKRIDGRLALRGRAFDASAVADPFTKQPLEPAKPPKPAIKISPLRQDKRLFAKVMLDALNPSFADVLDRIRKASGVELSLAPNLEDHDPKLGGFSGSFMAWQLMDLLATKALVDGEWQKVGDGYQLTAKESLARKKGQPAPAPKVALSKAQENRRWLSTDPKLRAKVTIVATNPPLEHVLQKLREASGVDLTLDAKLERHDPEFGDVQLRDTPVWTVMGFVAEKDLVDGRWEKADGGYRLTAEASKREKPAPSSARWLITGVTVALLAAGTALFVFVRRRRAGPARQAGPTPPKKT